jgi:hypothetical protein
MQAFSGLLVILRNNTAHITPSGLAAPCNGTVDLVANANGYNYQWVGPEGDHSGNDIAVSVRGTYTLTVSSQSGLCKTTTNVTIDGRPAPASTDIVSPTCTITTGSLSIDVQQVGDVYSFDNGNTFQTGSDKSGLPPGEYHLIVQDDGGCNSDVSTVTIDPQPLMPGTPDVSTKDPTCTDATGSVISTAQKPGDAYSFDNGETYTGLNVNDEAEPGDYTVIIRRSTDCLSEPVEVTVNDGPVVPDQPTITATSTLDGFVSLASSAAPEYIWLREGAEISEATTQTYKASEDGSYTVIVVSEDGCHSDPSDPYIAVIVGDIDKLVNAGFYPNPAHSHIYYQTADASVESVMYNSNGQQLSVSPVRTTDQLTFDIRDLSPGVYLLKIIEGGKAKTIRWIKQ